MSEVITVSLNDEASTIVAKLKDKKENVSDIFCMALISYYKRKVKKNGEVVEK